MTRGPVTADAVVAAVRDLELRSRNRTAYVGIDGCGAAGKSTLAGLVAAAVERAVVITVDDFATPRLTSWDYPRFAADVVAPLLAGRPARYQRWDWDTDRGAEWHDVPPGSLLVVEGVSCTRDEVGLPWDLRVWVEAPRELRLARALERDGQERLPLWRDVWLPSEEAYVAAQHPERRADLVVDGTR
jgi:uridine kinase